MDPAASPEPPEAQSGPLTRPAPSDRAVALLEVVLCSDFPTQFALATTLYAVGFEPRDEAGRLRVAYVATLSLVDAVLLVGLIVFFLRTHGESLRDTFLGTRPVGGEAQVGVPLTFVALGLAFMAIAAIQLIAPWLRTEERNPLQDLLQTPGDATAMAVVLVVAGGIREEIQRAFLLRRFEQLLGGPVVGVIVASVGFGAGHLIQGADVAIVTGLLGAFWAVVYLRRRSIVAPIVSHSGFNLLQLGQYFFIGR